MKKILLLLMGTVLMTGCMHHYDMTLVNGMKVTRVSKPKLDKTAGTYSYTDIRGHKKVVSASQVVLIAPHRDVDPKNGPPS